MIPFLMNPRISTKITVMVISMVLICSVSIGIGVDYLYRRDSLMYQGVIAKSIAVSMAAVVVPEEILEIDSTERKTKYWHQFRNVLQSALKNTDLMYLYILTKAEDDQEFKFIFAEKNNLNEFPFSSRESLSFFPLEAVATYTTGISSYTGIYYTDDQGYMFSGYAPVRDENGAVIALFGADFSADGVMAHIQRFRISIMVVLSFFVTLFIAVSLVYTKHSIDRPIRALSRLAGNIANGNLDSEVQTPSNDEIGKLSSDLVRVRDKLKGVHSEISSLVTNAANGRLNVRADIMRYTGDWRSLLLELNHLLDAIITPINEATCVLRKVAKGDFSARVEGDYKGDMGLIKDSVNTTAMGIASYLNDKLEAERAAHDSELAKGRAEAAAEAKMRFLANTSHEIRTPMNAIIGMTELLLRESIAPSTREMLLSIKHAGDTLLCLINDVLDLSKIESHKMEIMENEYYFASLIYDTISIIRTRLTGKPIHFIVNIDSRLPNLLVGDEVRLRQILLNVLSNAVKFTKKGFVRLVISGEVKASEVSLTFEVADSGIGIKPEDLKKLFGDFTQLDKRLNKDVEGTGLGLSIARSIARLMGGDITVTSEYGKGSVFTVTLDQWFNRYEPFAEVPQADRQRLLFFEPFEMYALALRAAAASLALPCVVVESFEEFVEAARGGRYTYLFLPASYHLQTLEMIADIVSPEGEGSQGEQPKLVIMGEIEEVHGLQYKRAISLPVYCFPLANIINDVSEKPAYREHVTTIRFTAPEANILIVDDIATNLKVAEGLMRPYRMQIETCESGIKALSLIKRKKYDLIFMDHMMPEMDGIKTTSLIRAMEGGRELSIIALTANAITGVKEMFLQNGFDDFLSKPINSAKLDSLLHKWIPRDKQIESEVKTTVAPVSLPLASHVEGIDMEEGVKRLGGNLEAYLQVVRTFVMHTPAILEKVHTVDTSSLYDFAVAVHGIKGSSMNICAERVGAMAQRLEHCAKNGDIDTVLAQKGEFVLEVEKLLTSLTSFIHENTKNAEKLQKATPDREQLEHMRKACLNFDMSAMLEVLAQMEVYEYAYGDDLVRQLRHELDNLEYEEVHRLLEEALGSAETGLPN